jgi:hypothetical protein
VNAPVRIEPTRIQINDDQACRDFLLCELRRMSTRARLAALECDSIGTALKGDLIGPTAALEWIADIDPGLLDLLGAPMVALA